MGTGNFSTKITKICKMCSNKFTMRDDDVEFYKSIHSSASDYCTNCRFTKRSIPAENREWCSNPLK